MFMLVIQIEFLYFLLLFHFITISYCFKNSKMPYIIYTVYNQDF